MQLSIAVGDRALLLQERLRELLEADGSGVKDAMLLRTMMERL